MKQSYQLSDIDTNTVGSLYNHQFKIPRTHVKKPTNRGVEIKRELLRTKTNNQLWSRHTWLLDGVMYRDPAEGPAMIEHGCSGDGSTSAPYSRGSVRRVIYTDSSTSQRDISWAHPFSFTSYYKINPDGSRVLHRDPKEGPAHCYRQFTSAEYSFCHCWYDMKVVEYWQDGVLTRDLCEGPARIEIYDTTFTPNVYKVPLRVWYIKDGVIQNGSNPAVLEFNIGGAVQSKTYYTDGAVHYSGQPAVTYHNTALNRRKKLNQPTALYVNHGVDYTEYRDQLTQMGFEEGTPEWEFTLEMLRS